MTRRPRNPRPDANQKQIRADLAASGFPHVWLDVSSLPVRLAGCDAGVIGFSLRHNEVRYCPVEIKMPGEQLNENEQRFFLQVQALGDGDIPLLAYRAEDILRWFGRL